MVVSVVGGLILGGAVLVAQSLIDRETQIDMMGNRSHACPPNYAMAGTNFGEGADGNTFKCEYVGTIKEHKIGKTQREGALGCEQGWFMTALNVVNNIARCSTTGRPMAIDTSRIKGTQGSASLAECSGSNQRNAAVMVGYRKDTAEILCSAVER